MDGLNYFKKDSADWELTQDIENEAKRIQELISRHGTEPDSVALNAAHNLLTDIEKWKAMCLGERMGNALKNSKRTVWDAFLGALDATNDRGALLSVMRLKGFGSSEDEETGQRRAKVATSVLRFLKPMEWGVVDWRTVAMLIMLDNSGWDVDQALIIAKREKADELRKLFDIIDEEQACSTNQKYRDRRTAPPLSRTADIEMAIFGLSLIAWPMLKKDSVGAAT
jgi:hypothetical protein